MCYCAHLLPMQTRTKVVFLQHPREAKVPIGTARMAHLMLDNSEIYRGVLFGEHPRVRELLADPAAALLFPGQGALHPAALAEVRTLVVVDGTWAQARKVLKENPILTGLPRIGLLPERPGNYRIRREPTPDCLATIEAVSRVLGVLEGDAPRFEAMLAAFTFMVDRQIELAASGTGQTRQRGLRQRSLEAEARQQDHLSRALVVHAEVNAHPRGSGMPGRPELLHLCAQRVATGESFASVIAPRRPLAENATYHLGLDEADLQAGEPIEEVLLRWLAFVRQGDVPCGWGGYTRDQLAIEGAGLNEWLDLRLVVARRFQSSPGTPAQAARRLFGPVAAVEPRLRAVRVVADLVRIVSSLLPLGQAPLWNGTGPLNRTGAAR